MNPMVDAISRKAKPKFGAKPTMTLPDAPRIFETSTKEIPGLKELRPGDKVAHKYTGRIHSVDQTGRVVIHIDKITPQ